MLVEITGIIVELILPLFLEREGLYEPSEVVSDEVIHVVCIESLTADVEVRLEDLGRLATVVLSVLGVMMVSIVVYDVEAVNELLLLSDHVRLGVVIELVLSTAASWLLLVDSTEVLYPSL